ncbi:MAG: hypothetical protein F6K55_07080 [Moorea sp. SIO4A3]|nr:hypothetical protein [Moorena sp. SIO4A3]
MANPVAVTYGQSHQTSQCSVSPFCLLPIAYCLLPIAFCLLPFVFCLLSFASCLFPFAFFFKQRINLA